MLDLFWKNITAKVRLWIARKKMVGIQRRMLQIVVSKEDVCAHKVYNLLVARIGEDRTLRWFYSKNKELNNQSPIVLCMKNKSHMVLAHVKTKLEEGIR